MSKKLICILITLSVFMGIPGVCGFAKDNGFVNPVEISYPSLNGEGFILPAGDKLPSLSDKGFIKETDTDFENTDENGFLAIPKTEMPVSDEDGFITPLEKEMPSVSEGFMKEPSKALAETETGEFIKEAGLPDEKAKVISSADALSDITSGKYILGCDIDLSSYNGGEWLPITPTGSVQLDGQGHKISGLNISEKQKEEYAGLFGKSVYSIKITNLGLVAKDGDEICVTPNYSTVYAGGFVACGNAIINNCFSDIPVRICGTASGTAYAGGLLGKSDGAVTNCYYYGEMINESKGYDIYCGGLLGYGRTALTDSFNRADINGSCTGGLVGSGGGSFVRCFNTGNFNGKLCGGLIGEGKNTILRFTDCYNTGNAVISGYTASFNGAGGLAGSGEKIVIENCFNKGLINSEGYGYAGGLAGEAAEIEISLSYNSGSINYNEKEGGAEFDHPMGSTDFGCESGGLAGKTDTAFIYNCINEGNVGGLEAGGFLGNGKLTSEYCINSGIVAGIKYSGGFLGCGVPYLRNLRNDGSIYGANFIENSDVYYDRNYSKTGGIVGGDFAIVSDGYIENCVNNGNITVIDAEGYLTKQTYCGGIAGFTSATVFECVNNGNITSSVKENTFTDLCVGGVVGSSSKECEIIRCINNGNISGSSYLGAGIIATDYDSYEAITPKKISSCINRGDILTGRNVQGIGRALEISDCFSIGNLKGSNAEGIGTADIVYNCFNKGSFRKDGIAGGFYGIAAQTKKISFCYNEGNGTDEAEITCGIAGDAEEVFSCFNNGSFITGDEGEGIVKNAVKITDCINRGDFTGADEYCAGIGNAETIINCSNYGDISSGRADTNGIGCAGTVLYCVNEGTLSSDATNLNDEEQDGIRGIGKAENYIEYCINNGDITGKHNGRMRGIGNASSISLCVNNCNIKGDDIAGIGIADEIRNCKNGGSLTEISDTEEYWVKIRGIGDGALIYNCTNSADIKSIRSGGISMNADSITACCNRGTITGRNNAGTAAGIYGGEESSDIVNSFNTGRISGVENGYGISGSGAYNAKSVNITNCYNNADISATVIAAGIAKISERIMNSVNSGYTGGGEAYGIAVIATDIINSYNSGSVYAKLSGAGIVKENFYQIVNCYNSGNVNVSDGGLGGGIALRVTKDCKITDTINKCGEVYVRSTASKDKKPTSFAGGIFMSGSEGSYAYLNNVKNTAKVYSGSEYEAVVGGICGFAPVRYERENETLYEYPYVLVDKDTKNSGTLSYSCEKLYNSNGELYLERVEKGQMAGSGKVGYTSVELPSDISISGGTLLIKGNSLNLTARVLPESGVDKTVIFSSDNPSVATVDANGKVTGTGDGEAIISATTVNGLTAYHKITVLGNAIAVQVYGYRNNEKYNGYKLEGAEVTVGNITAYTDREGMVIFDRSNFDQGASVKVKASYGEDYKVYEDEILILPTNLPKQTVSCFLEFIEEPIYFKSATVKILKTETDLLKEKGITAVPLLDNYGMPSTKSYAFDIEVDWRKCTEYKSSRSVYIRGLESGKILTLGEGVNYGCLASVFEVGETLELVATTFDNEGEFVKNSVAIPLQVRLTNVKVKVPDTETESLNKIDLMDDISIGLSLGELTSGKVDTEFKNGVLKIIIGAGDEDEKPVALGAFKGKRSISVDVHGGIEIPLTNVSSGAWDGYVTAAVKQEIDPRVATKSKEEKKENNKEDNKKEDSKVKLFEHRRDMLISGIPCYFSFGLSAGAEATIGFTGPLEKVTAGWGEIKVTGGAELRGGVGKKFNDDYRAEFGPKGEIEVELPVRITLDENLETLMNFDPVISGSVAAELIIKAKIVEIEGEVKLGSFKWDKTGIEWDHILKPDGVKTLELYDIGSGISPVGREYRANGGGFQGGASDGVMLLGLDESSGRNEYILYSNIIRSADGGVTAINGTPLLVFTEDNLGRDEENGLTAAYSLYENGKWSEPLYIDNDGTLDTNVCADGKFVVWEDTSVVLESGYTLKELLSLNEISAGVYNGEGYDSLRLTDNDVYDFGVKVKDTGAGGVAAWLSNTEGDLTSNTGVTSLHCAVYNNGWEDIISVDNIGVVTNLNIVSDGNNTAVVYKNSDNTFFMYEPGAASPVPLLENVGRYACEFINGELLVSWFDEERTLHINVGGREEKTVETAFLGSENPVIASNKDTVNIFWIEEDGIYYVTNADGSWSDLLCFISTDEHIKHLDCAFKDSENYILTYFAREEDATHLKAVDASLGKDIMIAGAEIKQDGNPVVISAYLLNNGEKTVDDVTINVSENGNTVYTETTSLSLLAGEGTEVELEFLPENPDVIHDYTVTVVCDGDYHEENNSRDITAGYADIGISDRGFKEGGILREQIYADITNYGTVPAEQTVVKIYKGENREKLLYEVELGKLEAGDTAPLKIDMVQEAGVCYRIDVETENDGNEFNNSASIYDDRLPGRKSTLIYNKETKTVTASIDNTEAELSEGELIWAIYSPLGHLDRIIKENFVKQEGITVIDKEIDAEEGSRIKVMLIKDLKTLYPGMIPLEGLIN